MTWIERCGLRRGSLVVLIVYGFVVMGGWLLLSAQLSTLSALAIFASLLVGGLVPGSALVRLVFVRPTLVHYLAFGTAAGLALWALGAVASHDTGIELLRWLPSIAGVALWIVPARRRERPTVPKTFPLPAIAGSVLAAIALLPALRSALRSQPLTWSGWYRYYVDLPFHIAITSEAAARAPQQAPWVAGTPLSYTWLFHGAMGVGASLSGATAAEMVLQVWPVLFAGLIPIVIAVVAWELTANRWAAAAAPVLFVVLHGPVFVPRSFVQDPLFQLSPTRDFADLFVLIALLSLVRLYERDQDRTNRGWWLVLLGISVFVATGSKGSALPILLGALLCVGLYLLVSRTLRRSDFVPVAVFAVVAVVSYFTVLPAPGLTDALTISPFSFLIPTTIHRLATSIEIVALLGIGSLGLWTVIGRSGPGRWVVATLMGGLLLAGLAGLALTNYPGDSQLYFWESAQPVLAIAFAWALSLLIARYRWRIAIVVVLIAGGGTGLWIVSQRVWLTELGVGAVALAAAIYFEFSRRFRDQARSSGSRRSRAVTILGCAVVLVLCAQAIALPVAASGGQSSRATDPSAISSGQLAAFTYIRLHSAPDDEVITNKHCRSGSVTTECDPHWFAVAAFTERRVLVDGWAYTQNGSSETWVRSQLEQSDGFISHPTAAAEKSLLAAGVRFVYVDTRLPYDRDLGALTHEVFSGLGARVYELR